MKIIESRTCKKISELIGSLPFLSGPTCRLEIDRNNFNKNTKGLSDRYKTKMVDCGLEGQDYITKFIIKRTKDPDYISISEMKKILVGKKAWAL